MMRVLALLLILLLLCIAAFVLLFLAVCLCAMGGKGLQSGDCILILGAKVKLDGSMSHALLSRCERALALWRDGAAKTVIACGGVCGGPVSEASAMRDFLLRGGVPEAAIFLEDQSLNTWENLRNARVMMEARGLRRAVLVTSDYHLARALKMAKKQGVCAVGVAAPSSKNPALFLKNRLRENVSWILYAWNEVKKKLR